MPHSPRIDHDGSVVLLDSGRGQIVRIDPANGASVDIAFCPGFLRGLSLHAGHAIVTVSKPRGGTFAGLGLEAAMRRAALAGSLACLKPGAQPSIPSAAEVDAAL